ncbi:copper amine oxidase N-terminal domain-containing protein [Xylanibacillus composti]|uniref:Copper amine oxidase-like N-terminal domain-containing protein n=1 Tax=Xylanibacillus composti TaxID=1572762 RepID=A0A8J4H5M6_9BACL|nr:copper amine oxidase N-terminal domain-containing protein [Xylanibacillus composti]GIQ71264.1 hypothetical protein XYCOK13_40880 [Xylanibacillus composti]
MNRKAKVGLAIAIASCSFAAGVHASDGLKKVEAFLRDDFRIRVDGKAISLDSPPLVYQGKTYLPVSDIGHALSAEVKWDGSTKTVYINPRIYDIQPTTVKNDQLDEMKISILKAMTAEYLGGTYPILVNDSYGGGRFFRELDLQRMGVNTSALVKVREKWSGVVYIAESEAKKAWKEQPKISYSFNNQVVVTETDEKKARVLRNFDPDDPIIPNLPMDQEPDPYSPSYYYSYDYRYTPGVLYSVDPIPGESNLYHALYYKDNKYIRYTLTLTPIEKSVSKDGRAQFETDWYISEYKSEYLGSPLDEYSENYFPY